MADTKISALPELTGNVASKDDLLAIVSGGATKKIKFETLINQASLATITVNSGKPIASAEIDVADDFITDGKIAANAINTGEIKDGQITAAKIDVSTGLFLFATSAPSAVFKGQFWVDTDDSNKLYIATATGSSNWAAVSAGTTTISGASGNIVNITATASGTTYTIDATIDDFNANTVLAGPTTGSAATPTARALVGADIPVATSSAKGGVIINGNGLVLDTHTLKVDNTVTASGTKHLVTYTANGLITGGAAITAGDLPVAASGTVGAVKTGTAGTTGIAISGAGEISINNSVTGATKAKVTYDANGLITAGADLADSDLPNHSASLLTSGTLPIARIADDAITAAKMANSSTCIVQSIAQAGFPTAAFTGQLCFDSVAEDAYLWDGNAWQAITTLTKGNLVNGGTYNASTSQMASVTTAGSAAGLVVGSNLPTPSATTDAVYVVVATAGTPSAPAPVVALNPPDYILGVTNSSGSSWNEIDLSATVSGQTAQNVSFTPFGQVSSTNCQDAIEELETEKMGKAGGTFTGAVEIGHGGSFKFEGTTNNAYETTLSVVDPTAARSIVLPNDSGTVILAAKASIVNADISTSAAIDYSKLATLTSGNIIIGNGSNVATSVAPSGDITLSSAGVFAIGSGVVINADIKSDAAIAFSKLAALTDGNILVGNGSDQATSVTPSGDISLSNTGVFSYTAGSIVNADINASAAIAGSKLAAGTTSAVGAVQLEDSVTSTSTTKAATPASVKSVKDSSAQLAGAVFTGPVDLGANTDGHDFRLYGDTSGAYIHWDESADVLKTVGGATIDIVKDKFKIGSVAVTTTAAELNVLDGIPGTLTATELGYVDGVTSAIQTQINAKGDASLGTANSWTKPQRGNMKDLGSTVNGNLDLTSVSSTDEFSNYTNFKGVLSGATTMKNFTITSAMVGQSGMLRFQQDGTGGREISWESKWVFPEGTKTVTTTASAYNNYVYFVEDTARITVVPLKDVKAS